MPTSGAWGLLIVTAIKSQLGCWEVLDVDNALGGVWHVFTRSKHGWLPWKKGWDQSIKVIPCPVYIESRIPATVSIFGSHYLDCLIILHAQNLSDQTSAVNKNDRLFIYTSPVYPHGRLPACRLARRA